MKFISWNVNGLRACMKKGFQDFFKSVDADIVALQETKMKEEQKDFEFEGYNEYWNCADKAGYSGTLIYAKKKPLNVIYGINGLYNDEGRAITLEYENFYFVTVYSPNSKAELLRLDYRMEYEDRLREYLIELDKKKPVILCGDLNVAHNPIDLKNPKTNERNAGYTIEERTKFSALLDSGFVDSRGDHVLVHSPTYVGFTHCLTDNGYNIVHSPLKKDEIGVWRMDLADMEEKLRKYKIHAALFCSPHNPCGRVWEREELERMMELFKKYDVTVVSDEIWSDLTLSGYKHIPTQTVSEDAKKRTIALYAPTKTFNLAGLIGSYHIIYDPLLRDRVRKESQNTHYNSMNVLSMYALIGAYGEEGRVWVDELRQVLTENADFACDFIEKHFDGVTASRPQGTYMLFLDCGEWCRKHGKTMDELERAGISVGVIWQDGRRFHGENSVRMNLALPHSLVKEAFERLDRYVFNA